MVGVLLQIRLISLAKFIRVGEERGIEEETDGRVSRCDFGTIGRKTKTRTYTVCNARS